MIGLDTNVLARYYVVDQSDVEAVRQRPLAAYEGGIAFGDALHHANYYHCDSMATFDDRKFARRVAALGLPPPVVVLR